MKNIIQNASIICEIKLLEEKQMKMYFSTSAMIGV